MFSILLPIIYIAFISLGLPDSLIGSAWPAMHETLNVPVSYAGIITMTISVGTVISSLAAGFLSKKFRASTITAASILLTAIALLGFSIFNSFTIIWLLALPYGLGAGAIDATLNNYVAIHYASKHMSWLHAFWGIGASLSPYIMGFALTNQHNWQLGYKIIGIIQLIITLIIVISFPQWRKVEHTQSETTLTDNLKEPMTITTKKPIRTIKGIIPALLTFIAYAAVEQTSGLWASTFFVSSRHISIDIAAMFASLFYIGITVGRLISGFVADYFTDRQLIHIGMFSALLGTILLFVPYQITALFGLLVIGLGCAPVFPSLIHATPTTFGKKNSQSIMGFQMASSYLGTTFLPPLFGIISSQLSTSYFPLYIFIFVIIMIITSYKIPFSQFSNK